MLESLTKEELISQLHSVFGNVTREGGVSWNEAGAIDGYGSEAECVAARASDRDRCWMDVAEDDWRWSHNWRPWSFLDSIGYRYYLVAAIARDLIFDSQVLAPSEFDFVPKTIKVSFLAPISYAPFWIQCILPLERTFIANYILHKAEQLTRNALMAVLDEADMTYDQYLQSEESWWTPDPIWSEWLEPLEDFKQFLSPKPPAKFDTTI